MDTQTDKENNTPATAHKQVHSSDANGNDKMTCEKDNDTSYDEDDENNKQTQEESMEDYMLESSKCRFNCQIPARTNIVSRRTKHTDKKKITISFTLATNFSPLI